MKVAHLIGN